MRNLVIAVLHGTGRGRTGIFSQLQRRCKAAISAALICALAATPLTAAERPNVLWLSIEDASSHIGAYGVEHAVTPNLDRLAERGVRFDRAYAPAPVCAVARSALITGIYSVAQGSQHMRTDIARPESILPFPHYLREAGYFTTNRVKMDYQFELPEGVWDRQGRDHRDWEEREDASQPFFSVINFTGTHESKNLNEYDPDLFEPGALELPPFYPDTPGVRRAWASYFQNMHAADDWVAENLQRLEDQGLAEDTIVVFWADHGVGFARAKRWVYEMGLKVPMIIHVPEKWRERFGVAANAGVNAELVSFVDFAPTMLAIAGVERPEYMQGRVFLGPEKESAPDALFGHRDRMDERIDIIRVAIGERWKYKRNFEYFKPHLQFNETPETHEYSRINPEIRAAHAADPDDPVAGWYFEYKPVEELYDLSNDPFEMNDLAGDPEFAEELEAMHARLEMLQDEIGDLGSIPEPLLRRWRETYGSEYAIRTEHRHLADEAWAVLRELHRLDAAQLASKLDDDNAAVRYWAATGLGNLAADEGAHAQIEAGLGGLLVDPEPVVRIAAARGLLLAGDSIPALEALATIVEDAGADWADQLYAMLAIDDAGYRAAPLEERLANIAFENKYPRRVRDHLLPDIATAPPAIPPLPGKLP